MGHDASKVQLGATRSSIKEVDNRVGVIEAGYIVRLKSDDTISKAAADGNPLGISLGRDLSAAGFTSICRKGLAVPVRLKSGFTTPAIGAQAAIDDTSGDAVDYTGSGNGYVNAVYATGMITGVDEDGNSVNVALIDFPGGL